MDTTQLRITARRQAPARVLVHTPAQVLVHALVAVLTTMPLAWRMWSRIPLGREPVATVPWFNLWSWRWTAETLPHSWSNWWDAPIFAPLIGTYARSELQPVTGLAFGVLDRVLPATAAYGLLVLLAVTANGVAAAAVARRLGVGRGPALVAGCLAQVVPFAFDQLGVVQLLMLWPVLVALWALLGWFDRPTVSNAAVLGTAVAVAILTCGYHAVLFVCCAGVASPLALRSARRRWWRRSTWATLWRERSTWWPDARHRTTTMALAVALAATLAGPFVLGQQRRLVDVRWTDETILIGSASWADLAPGGSRSAGIALLVLGVAGAVIGRRRRHVRYVAGIVVVATVMAVGLRLSVFGLRPYDLVIDHVGALARLRSPFRATATAQVGLAVLSGIAVERLWQARRRAVRALVPVALGIACWSASLGAGPMVALPRTDLVWIEWLAEHPGGAVVMLPPAPGRGVADFEPTAAAMLQGLDHGHPLANGYTGFFPPGQFEQRELWASFPADDAVADLRERGVRYAVADAAWWGSDRDAAARALGLEVVLAGPDGVLIDLGPFSGN